MPTNNLNLSRLADFLFEAGMLRKTPRSGYQFLGSGSENVAEHSFRTSLIGYVLAQMAGANAEHTALLCLIHDFHEARTGDFNYVNSIYNTSDQRGAMRDAVQETGLEEPLMALWEEQEEGGGLEAALSRDADQIDLILNLVEERELGNKQAQAWLDSAEKRLRTPEGKALAEKILVANPIDWWHKKPDSDWWINRNKKR